MHVAARDIFHDAVKYALERVLYLAVPEDAYDRFCTLQFAQDALWYNEVRYLMHDVLASEEELCGYRV